MDPNGDYNVGDVTVELDGVEITKGDGAKCRRSPLSAAG